MTSFRSKINSHISLINCNYIELVYRDVCVLLNLDADKEKVDKIVYKSEVLFMFRKASAALFICGASIAPRAR